MSVRVHDAGVNGLRIGLQFRALRVRRELRQEDAGRLSRLSRSIISRIERGLIDNLRIADLEGTAAAVGATLEVRLRWRGEALDRLLDEAHATLVDAMVALLRAAGWEVAVEVSFAIWGERGSIDVLAFHPATGILLVVEVKSVVPDSQATLAGLDRKSRLAARIAAERGWKVRNVARLLVVGDSATSRRRVARLEATFAAALPLRGRAVRRWLGEPDGAMSGLFFLPFAPGVRGTSGARPRERVRRRLSARRSPVSRATSPAERV
jgi:transcriptional regulator with XRE-family HTH domain